MIALLLAGCVGTWMTQEDPPAEGDVFSATGTFVAADAAEIWLEPEQFSGSWTLQDVLEHGTLVKEGQTVARFDAEALEKAIRDAERELRGALLRHEHLERRQQLAEASDARALEAARIALERAKKSLEGWFKHELPLRRRSEDRSRRGQEIGVENQRDELAQLEAMYREDELTDETEEIVLRRSRQSLAMSLEGLELSEDRRKYSLAYEEPVETTQREEAVETAEHNLRQLLANQEMSAAERREERLGSEERLEDLKDKLRELQEDRALLALAAPRSGLLMHGALADYEPGKVAPRYREKNSVPTGKPLFHVAAPDRFEVRLSVAESDLSRVQVGMAVEVSPACDPGRAYAGTLRRDRFPDPASAGQDENKYAAQVTVGDSIPGVVPGMRARIERPGDASAGSR